jgi:hypothetical protein
MGKAHLRREILLTEGTQCAKKFGGIFDLAGRLK